MLCSPFQDEQFKTTCTAIKFIFEVNLRVSLIKREPWYTKLLCLVTVGNCLGAESTSSHHEKLNVIEIHDDVIKWKHFPRYWPFVRRIHRSPVNSPHKGQWRGAFMFSLICVWMNDWVNNGEAGDLRRYLIHYDVTVMIWRNVLGHVARELLPGLLTRYSVVQSSRCNSSEDRVSGQWFQW